MTGLALLLAALLQFGTGDAPARPKQYVAYTAESQTVPAARKSTVELRFRVVEGFHVNSHTPASDLLIPTNLTLQPTTGVKTGPAEYPKGQSYSFSFSPGEKLDVYSGAFTIRLPVEAAPGEHTVEGTLHYQACDHAACYPPKSLPVQVIVSAK